MIRALLRVAVASAIGFGSIGVASATTYTFDTTSSSDSVLNAGASNAQIFTATGNNNTTLKVRVTAWHATATSDSTDSIAAAKLGLFTPGLGVLYGSETANSNEHQIDNIGGVDFVMLQFNQNVQLTGFGRKVYQINGVSGMDSDASYWADTTGAVGSASNWNSAIDISGYTLDETLWGQVAGGSADSSALFTPGKTAAVWLVSAAFDPKSSANGNDGFKINSITAASVPETSTWGMMMIGFGVIGFAARRRSAAARATAAA